jgi:hypothetical protein
MDITIYEEDSRRLDTNSVDMALSDDPDSISGHSSFSDHKRERRQTRHGKETVRLTLCPDSAAYPLFPDIRGGGGNGSAGLTSKLHPGMTSLIVVPATRHEPHGGAFCKQGIINKALAQARV